MNTPETRGGDHERFLMMHKPEEYGLSLAQQAVLRERYEEDDWHDEEAELFYERVFAEIQAQPGEFLTVIKFWDHGISIDALLPKTDDPIADGYVGGVVLRHQEHVDLSERIPRWNYFPHGFEIFIPNDGFTNVAFRDPEIDLKHVRANTSRGQYNPTEHLLLIGNKVISEILSNSLIDGSLDETKIIDILCAFALVSEGVGAEIPIVPEAELMMARLESTYQKHKEEFLSLLAKNSEYIDALKITSLRSEADRLEIQTDMKKTSQKPHSNAFSLRDTRTWPYEEIGSTDMIAASQEKVIKKLGDERKEILDNLLPLSEFYLSAIRRYLVSSIKQQK